MPNEQELKSKHLNTSSFFQLRAPIKVNKDDWMTIPQSVGKRPTSQHCVLFDKLIGDSEFNINQLDCLYQNLHFAIDFIESRIADYNENPNLEDINSIMKRLAFVDGLVCGYVYSRLPSYKKFHNRIESDCIRARQSLMYSAEESISLSLLIQNMSPAHLKKFYRQINSTRKNEFVTPKADFYPASDERPEAIYFKEFFQQYRLQCIHHNNSLIYHARPKEKNNGKQEILKLDGFLQLPTGIHWQLDKNNELKSHLSKITVHRKISGRVVEEHLDPVAGKLKGYKFPTMINVTVTDFHSNGSLRKRARTRSYEHVEQMKEEILNIFEQMAQIFIDFSSHHYCFSDAKLENFLLDAQDKLCIVDIKSIIKTDEANICSKSLNKLGFVDFITTSSYSPPEYEQSKWHGGQAHAYLLGKCLEYFILNLAGRQKDLVDEFYQSRFGSLIKLCIYRLCEPNLKTRISVEQFMHILTHYIKTENIQDYFREVSLKHVAKEKTEYLAMRLEYLYYHYDNAVQENTSGSEKQRDFIDLVHELESLFNLDMIIEYIVAMEDYVDSSVVITPDNYGEMHAL